MGKYNDNAIKIAKSQISLLCDISISIRYDISSKGNNAIVVIRKQCSYDVRLLENLRDASTLLSHFLLHFLLEISAPGY